MAEGEQVARPHRLPIVPLQVVKNRPEVRTRLGVRRAGRLPPRFRQAQELQKDRANPRADGQPLSIDGLRVDDAIAKVNAWLEQAGVGKGTVSYRLRDWLFSRQR